MMRNIFLTLLLFACMSVQVGAQSFSVKFTAKDTTGEGEPFATVRIYQATDTTKAVKIGVTDIDGKYSETLAALGDYQLMVSAVGKVTATRGFQLSKQNPSVDLGVILMRQAGNVLGEVTVTAQAPLVSQEIDRLNYNVQSDPESKVKNTLDMLRKVPLVTVDGQDNIKVRGSGNFKIYKNGHPDPTLSQNAKDVLKAIPASMIKRIEVITEPGAKYDAEGVAAILNIVTTESSSMKGVTGTVYSNVNNMGTVGAGGYITTQVGKVTTSLNYGYNHGPRSQSKQRNEGVTHYGNTGNTLSTTGAGDASVNVHYGNIESSWEPDTLNLLTLNFGGYYYDYTADGTGTSVMTDAAGQQLYAYNSRAHMPGTNYYSFDGRFDYQHKTHVKDEALTLSYMISTSRSHNKTDYDYEDMVNFPLPYTGYRQRTSEDYLEQTGQLDWTRPFLTHNKFETGLKYINRLNKSHTTMDYLGTDAMQDLNNRFRHLTQVAAAYASYTYSNGPWAARAGLRYEYSYLKASYPDGSQESFHTSLNDWVPSASLSYMPSWQNTFKIAFATRINRPGISYLNPAVVSTPQTKSFGNPNLKSVRNYSVSLTYMHNSAKLSFQVAPMWAYSDNGIGAVQTAEGDQTVTTYGNVIRSLAWGSSQFLQWRVTDKTSLQVNADVSWTSTKAPSLDIKASGWNYSVWANASQDLPWKLKLSGYLGAWHNAPDLYGHFSGPVWYGFSLQRSFLKEDRLTVQLQAQRPFSDRYTCWKSYTDRGDYTGRNFQWGRQGQSYQISISYRFGSLKAQVKKTDTTIENNDVVGGASKGGNNQMGGGGK